MSILSVDTIQPIGSGSTVTLNAAKIVVGTGITFESNGQAIYAGIITATSFVGNLTGNPTGTLQTAAQPNITSVGTLSGLTVSGTSVVADIKSTNNNYVLGLRGNNSSVKVYLGTDNSGNFLLATGSGVAERLRIASDGKITVAANSDIRFTNGTWTGEVAGKIQQNSNNLYIQGGTGGIRFRHASSGVNQFSMTNGGNFEITDGDLKIATAGHGIDFAATSNAGGMTSELLDDYEEGSFSPTYDAPNQGGAGFTHFHNYGYYTKVGNIVNVTVYIQGYCSSNAGGGSNDDLKVMGLPFAPATLPGSGSSNRHVANWAIGSRYKLECDDLTASTYGGNTYIDLLVPSNGGTGTQLKTNQADQNTTQFWATATYRVA